jgi:hypothetical protein
MNIKHNARAVLFGIVITAAAAPAALATSEFVPLVSRTHVMTDPCANVMNWPVRSIVLNSTPPSERGLQCPIQEQVSAPFID